MLLFIFNLLYCCATLRQNAASLDLSNTTKTALISWFVFKLLYGFSRQTNVGKTNNKMAEWATCMKQQQQQKKKPQSKHSVTYAFTTNKNYEGLGALL